MAAGEEIARKRCRDCDQELTLDAFPPQARTRDGRGTYCRTCMNVRHRASRDARREQPRQKHRNAEPPGARTRKWCPQCQQEQPIEAFGANRSSPDGHTAYCKPCHNARGKETYVRLHGSTRSYHLKRRYGLTPADVDAMVAAQGGLCALCRDRPPQHVDHDHLTGLVRGVLCSGCNQGLGNLRDHTAVLRCAIDYLENPSWHRTQASTAASRPTSLRLAAPRSSTSSA